MYTYYSSFISGVHDIIKDNLVDCNIKKIMDGGILYTTNKTPDEILKIKFFNNSFLVIKTFENIDAKSPIEYMIKNINFNHNKLFLKHINSKQKTFHIFSSIENQFVSTNKSDLSIFEKKLEKLTGLKVEIDKKIVDLEFWFLYRSENIGFFMLRITKNKKKLKDGELRPELTNILCILSKPNENDIFLDPFCGSGAIPLERSRIKSFRGIFACDKNEEIIKNLKQTIKKISNKKLNKSFFAKNIDFLKNNFDNEYFTTIVTDPPWGFFEKIDNIFVFYNNILNKMHRILIKNGIIVLLSANKEEINTILQQNQNKFNLINNYNILVSGKKAGIYVIQKI